MTATRRKSELSAVCVSASSPVAPPTEAWAFVPKPAANGARTTRARRTASNAATRIGVVAGDDEQPLDRAVGGQVGGRRGLGLGAAVPGQRGRHEQVVRQRRVPPRERTEVAGQAPEGRGDPLPEGGRSRRGGQALSGTGWRPAGHQRTRRVMPGPSRGRRPSTARAPAGATGDPLGRWQMRAVAPSPGRPPRAPGGRRRAACAAACGSAPVAAERAEGAGHGPQLVGDARAVVELDDQVRCSR